MKVSKFSSIYSQPSPPVTVESILSDIQTGRWQKPIEELRLLSGEDYRARKKKLPAFTVTGVFDSRSDEGFVEHSGLTQVDIDAKDQPELTYKEMWERVVSCPHVYAAFKSPSGRGVKALVRCQPDRTLHSGSHAAAVQWLADRGVVVDKNASALSQACFVSYDPDLYRNTKARPIEPVEVAQTNHSLREFDESRPADQILRECGEHYGTVFTDLWEGEYAAHTPDHSAADFRLIAMLREHCHSNEMVAELFEQSGLYRVEKWNGRTRDYVFAALRKCAPVEALNLLEVVPEDPTDPSPERKVKAHKGWSWETAGDIPMWTAEEDNYIIKHLIYERSMSAIYGPPGSGKTFYVLSIGCAVATGKDWNGRKTKQGGVLYFGLEGKRGLRKRVQALKVTGQLPDDAPFALVQGGRDQLDLCNPEHVKKMVETIRAYEAETGMRVSLVFVDTLAKATPGSDENSSQDMGKAISHAEMVTTLTGCHVCLVHHSGKDASKGMRGSTVLLGGLDGVFEVGKHPDDPSIRVFKSTKQRDEKDDTDIYARLEVVTLGLDHDLEPVTTCVIVFVDPATIPKTVKGKNDLDLIDRIPAGGISLSGLVDAAGIGRSTVHRQVKILMDEGLVKKNADGNLFRVEIFDDLDALIG